MLWGEMGLSEGAPMTEAAWSAFMLAFLRRTAERHANIALVVPSTPAQLFHALRRQANLPYQRPLVVAAPKLLHHHRPATSALRDFDDGAGPPLAATVPCAAERCAAWPALCVLQPGCCSAAAPRPPSCTSPATVWAPLSPRLRSRTGPCAVEALLHGRCGVLPRWIVRLTGGARAKAPNAGVNIVKSAPLLLA